MGNKILLLCWGEWWIWCPDPDVHSPPATSDSLLPSFRMMRGRWLWEGIVFRKIIPGGLFMEVHTQASLFLFLWALPSSLPSFLSFIVWCIQQYLKQLLLARMETQWWWIRQGSCPHKAYNQWISLLVLSEGVHYSAPDVNASAAIKPCCLSRKAPFGPSSPLTLCWPSVNFINIMLCSWKAFIKYLLISTWLILQVSKSIF